MTKIMQFSAAAMLVAFASTAFVSTANAASNKVWCKQTSTKIFRTSCEEPRRIQRFKRYQRPTTPGTPIKNFRSRTDRELGLRSLDGGNNSNGDGGRGGRK